MARSVLVVGDRERNMQEPGGLAKPLVVTPDHDEAEASIGPPVALHAFEDREPPSRGLAADVEHGIFPGAEPAGHVYELWLLQRDHGVLLDRCRASGAPAGLR